MIMSQDERRELGLRLHNSVTRHQWLMEKLEEQAEISAELVRSQDVILEHCRKPRRLRAVD